MDGILCAFIKCSIGRAYARLKGKEMICMELVPWRPFRALGSFYGEMDRLRERWFGERPLVKALTEKWLPSVDISETKDDFIVKAELPGLEAKDVNVSISGDLLIIKGEKKKDEEEKDEHHYIVERYSGSFQRVFQLPAAVKSDKLVETFEKGVLKMTLPKVEETKKKEIKIA